MTYDEAVKFLIYEKPGHGPVWLGNLLGIKSQAVNGWFQKGKRVPAGRDIKIAEAFNVDPAALRKGRIEEVSSLTNGSVEIDAEIVRNLLNTPHDKRMLDLWVRLEGSVKLATLDILEAVTRIAKIS